MCVIFSAFWNETQSQKEVITLSSTKNCLKNLSSSFDSIKTGSVDSLAITGPMASASGAPQCLVQDLTSILLMQLIYSQLRSRPHNSMQQIMANQWIGRFLGRVGSSEFQNVPMFWTLPSNLISLLKIWEPRTAAMVPRLRLHETPVLKPSFLKNKDHSEAVLSTCFVCNSRHYEYRRKQALGDRCMISLCVCARVTLKLHIPVKCVNCTKWHVAPCQNRNIINFIAVHGILAERANHTHRGWQDGRNILKKKPLC